MSDHESVHFARVNRTGDELSEVRFMLPRPRLDVLDALAIFETRSSGETVSRRELCERIINEYIQNKIDESILIQSVFNRNPSLADTEK